MISLNTKSQRIQLSPTDRALRIATILLWMPAFGLLLAHGIITARIFPVLGIIPLSFSSLSGLLHLWGMKSRAASNLIDLFVGSFLLAMLVVSWVKMDGYGRERYWYYHSGNIMLATYGTVPMMTQFGIHLYFIIRAMVVSGFLAFSGMACPHCNGDLLARGSKRPAARGRRDGSPVSQDSRESYHPVMTQTGNQEDGIVSAFREPRPSTDDETAPLV